MEFNRQNTACNPWVQSIIVDPATTTHNTKYLVIKTLQNNQSQTTDGHCNCNLAARYKNSTWPTYVLPVAGTISRNFSQFSAVCLEYAYVYYLIQGKILHTAVHRCVMEPKIDFREHKCSKYFVHIYQKSGIIVGSILMIQYQSLSWV